LSCFKIFVNRITIVWDNPHKKDWAKQHLANLCYFKYIFSLKPSNSNTKAEYYIKNSNSGSNKWRNRSRVVRWIEIAEDKYGLIEPLIWIEVNWVFETLDVDKKSQDRRNRPNRLFKWLLDWALTDYELSPQFSLICRLMLKLGFIHFRKW